MMVASLRALMATTPLPSDSRLLQYVQYMYMCTTKKVMKHQWNVSNASGNRMVYYEETETEAFNAAEFNMILLYTK